MDGDSAYRRDHPAASRQPTEVGIEIHAGASDFTCRSLTETVRINDMGKKTAASNAASVLGKRSFKARVERFGIERLQEIARENGKLGGRPKGTGKKQPKKGAE